MAVGDTVFRIRQRGVMAGCPYSVSLVTVVIAILAWIIQVGSDVISNGDIKTGALALSHECDLFGVTLTATVTTVDGSAFKGAVFAQNAPSGCAMAPGVQQTFRWDDTGPCSPSALRVDGTIEMSVEMTVRFNRYLLLKSDLVHTVTCRFSTSHVDTVSLTRDLTNNKGPELTPMKAPDQELSLGTADDLSMDFEGDGGDKVTTTDIGDAIFLTVAIKPESDIGSIVFETCWASNGLPMTDQGYRRIGLVEERCVAMGADSIVIGQPFYNLTAEHSTRANLALTAFVFLSDTGNAMSTLSVGCKVRLCPRTMPCEQPTCPAKQRRRRSASEPGRMTAELGARLTVRIPHPDTGDAAGLEEDDVSLGDCLVNTDVAVPLACMIVITVLLLVITAALVTAALRQKGASAEPEDPVHRSVASISSSQED